MWHGDDGMAGSQRGFLHDPKVAAALLEAVLGIETTHSGGCGVEERRGKVDSDGVAIGGVGVRQRGLRHAT